MPNSVFVEGGVLFALHHLVPLGTDGKEDLHEENDCIALCQQQQWNGCKTLALSTSVTRFAMTPSVQWTDSHHTFTNHLSIEVTTCPILVGM